MNKSPLPWETVGNGIMDSEGAFVLLIQCGDTMTENMDLAAKIKNCMNSHADLLAALENLLAAQANWDESKSEETAADLICCESAAKSVIGRAKGEQP